MATIFHFALVWSALIGMSYCAGDCKRFDWSTKFDREGASICDTSFYYIRGFYRSRNRGDNDRLYLLEEAECCHQPDEWNRYYPITVFADWSKIFDNNHQWVKCPSGYFLTGLYRSGNDPGWLNNIEEGRCTKPAEHPTHYGHCYEQDISACFDNTNLCRCKDDYYVTGLYRGSSYRLYNLETLYCCKLADKKTKLDSSDKVKTRIMDITLMNIANFAHGLGYGNSYGCRATYVGEDFSRVSDTWEADNRCSDYKIQGLKIAYGDWSYAIKDIQFGTPLIEDLQPQTIDTGMIENDHSTISTETLTLTETSVRTVTHTTTSSWSSSAELGVEIGFTPIPLFGGPDFSYSYNFGYETGSSITDSTGNEQSSTFQISTTKDIPAYSKAKWQVVLSKTRTTVPYTATIISRFSAELQGFLNSNNYHYQHKGNNKGPTVNYRFGDSKTPFYTAVKKQSETNSRPWLWNSLKSGVSGMQFLIDRLSDENRYVFQLTGKFEEVHGTRVDLKWSDFESTTRHRVLDLGKHRNETIASETVKHSKTVAKAGPSDPPSPNVDPPVVNIEVPEMEEDGSLIVLEED